MLQINGEVIKENLEKWGKKALNFLRETNGEIISKERDSAFAEAIEIGIESTVAALNEVSAKTKFEDTVIYELLQKYWGIDRDEAIERLKAERIVEAPCRALKEYLKGKLGLDDMAIKEYMRLNLVRIHLRHHPEFCKYTPEKLKKEIEKLNKK